MIKLQNIMKKLIFLLLIFLCISCQIRTNDSSDKENNWLTQVENAIDLSEKTGKPIFALFTGKDWCSWCKKLELQILSQELFIDYAKENLILLELDFPRGKRNLPQKQLELARKFNIRGYPTIILMDASTNELGRTGYESVSTEQYITLIKSLIQQ